MIPVRKIFFLEYHKRSFLLYFETIVGNRDALNAEFTYEMWVDVRKGCVLWYSYYKQKLKTIFGINYNQQWKSLEIIIVHNYWKDIFLVEINKRKFWKCIRRWILCIALISFSDKHHKLKYFCPSFKAAPFFTGPDRVSTFSCSIIYNIPWFAMLASSRFLMHLKRYIEIFNYEYI